MVAQIETKLKPYYQSIRLADILGDSDEELKFWETWNSSREAAINMLRSIRPSLVDPEIQELCRQAQELVKSRVGTQCPVCGRRDSRVLESRNHDQRGATRRRRECLACGERYTTYEVKSDFLEKLISSQTIIVRLAEKYRELSTEAAKMATLLEEIQGAE
jgi:hypothetical protein